MWIPWKKIVNHFKKCPILIWCGNGRTRCHLSTNFVPSHEIQVKIYKEIQLAQIISIKALASTKEHIHNFRYLFIKVVSISNAASVVEFSQINANFSVASNFVITKIYILQINNEAITSTRMQNDWNKSKS